MPMMERPQTINGYCEEPFRAVQEAFAENFAHRGEIGGAVAVFFGGRKVVDLWGGVQDKTTGVPWHDGTISILFSLAKAMCALSVHMLADRKLIDLDSPVVRYWPEFASGDERKQGVLVRHVLSHNCGVLFNDHARSGDVFDFDAMVRAIERQELAWSPGERAGYNTVNIGYMLGKLVLNVTGRSISEFLRSEVCRPLGADYAIGIEAADFPRVATLYPTTSVNEQFSLGRTPGTSNARAWTAMPAPYDVDVMNSPAFRVGGLPSFGGFGAARGMARVYAALAAGGTLDGVTLLSEEALRRATALQWEVERDEILNRPLRMSMGFFKNSPGAIPMGPNPEAFGHFGSGGALAFADRERNLSFACQSNLQSEGSSVGERTEALVEAVFQDIE